MLYPCCEQDGISFASSVSYINIEVYGIRCSIRSHSGVTMLKRVIQDFHGMGWNYVSMKRIISHATDRVTFYCRGG